MIRTFLAAGALLLFAVSSSVHTGAQSPPAAPPAPTYSRDIAPILYKNCTTCHRPGEIGPMSLLTYKDARPWAKSIAARVEAGTMPPWHADPSIGEFENDRRLSPADKDTIARWVAGGAPEGDPAELPAPPKYADGWLIGQPDAILTMQEDYAIPASGTIAYQYFEVPTSFAEDRWIQAFEVRPGNRTVVHHVIVYTRPPAPAAPPTPAAQSGPRPAPLF
jgi:mono/diheme cytochrome c family protein